jgi:uncharacterized protein YdaU (DUF1376 family)
VVAFYKHNIADWMDGTESMTCEQYRVYHVVCQLIYLNEGPIANNEKGIAGRCNLHLLAYRSALNHLVTSGKLTLDPLGKIANRRSVEELSRVDQNRVNAGKGGRAARKPLNNRDEAEAPLPLQGSLIDKTRQDETREKHSKRIVPPDWRPSSDTASNLIEKGYPKAALGRELEAFRNYHRSKGNKFADIDAAFRNWMAKSREFAAVKTTGPPDVEYAGCLKIRDL